ncbi:MAG: hypothetical protein GF320_10140 [Armatimonadia bacterium]|nr:hypothetical protein [Armatimonadia bacterium]
MSRLAGNRQEPIREPSDARPEQRRLSVIMFADIVGYSRITERDEALALHILERLQEIGDRILSAHGGRRIKSLGDGFLAEFSSALDAAEAAVGLLTEINALKETDPPEWHFDCRVALHVGDVVHKGDDVFGTGVNVAARLQECAEPGQICVSVDVARLVARQLKLDVARVGHVRLKNIDTPIETYRIVLPWQQGQRAKGLPGAQNPALRGHLRVWASLAAALLLVSALVVFHLTRSRPAEPQGFAPADEGTATAALDRVPLSASRVAVLPFENYSGEGPQDEVFADGITEQIITTLSKISGLRVIARTSVMAFKDSDSTVGEIARQLGTGTILEGSVRRQGDQLRVTVQLIDAETEEHIWAEDYDRHMEDVLAIQSDIATQVAKALEVHLLPTEMERLEAEPVSNLGALDLYILGRARMAEVSPDGLEDGAQRFREAIEVDPTFAPAYAALAEARAYQVWTGLAAPWEALRDARRAATTALELDPNLPEAYIARAVVRMVDDGNLDASLRDLDRAVELEPSSAYAHVIRAWNLAFLGREQEALDAVDQGASLDPRWSLVTMSQVGLYADCGRVEEGLSIDHELANQDPDAPFVHMMLGQGYEILRQYDRALEFYQQALDHPDERIFAKASIARIRAIQGEREQAEEILEELEALAETPEGYVQTAYALMVVHAALGNVDQALRYLERCVELRQIGVLAHEYDFRMDPIRDDPRFDDIIARIYEPIGEEPSVLP